MGPCLSSPKMSLSFLASSSEAGGSSQCRRAAAVSPSSTVSQAAAARDTRTAAVPAAAGTPLSMLSMPQPPTDRGVLGLVDGAPGYLDVSQWTSHLDVPVIKARATALELGINAVLNPILDEILGAGGEHRGMLVLPRRPTAPAPPAPAGDDDGGTPSSSSSRAALRLDAAAALVPSAAAAASQGGARPAPSAPAAVGGMLCVLNALARAAADGGHAVPPELFRVSSADRLVLSLVEGQIDGEGDCCGGGCDEDGVEGDDGDGRRDVDDGDPSAAWHAWMRLLSSFGAHQGHVAVALGPASKAALAALHAPLAAAGPNVLSGAAVAAEGSAPLSSSSAPFARIKRSKRTGRPVLEVFASDSLCRRSDTPALDAVAAAVASSGVLCCSSPGNGTADVAVAGPCEIRVTWSLDDEDDRSKVVPFPSRAAAVRELFRRAGRELVGLPSIEDGRSAPLDSNGAKPPAPPPLFVFLRSAGRVWFSPSLAYSRGAAEGYRLSGWLFAQALASRAPLCLPLPDVLFERLCTGTSFSASLEALAEFDAEAAGAVRAAASLDSPTYSAILEAEGMPAGTSRSEFARAAARAALVDGVAWQFDALASGFAAGADRAALLRWRLTPSDLAELVGGEGSAAAGVTAELVGRSMAGTEEAKTSSSCSSSCSSSSSLSSLSRGAAGRESSSSALPERLQQLLELSSPPASLPLLKKAARVGAAGETAADVVADAR